MPDRFQIGEYWLGQRGGSDQWYRCWYESGKGKRRGRTKRASLGTTDFQSAQLKLAEWIIKNANPKNQKPNDVLLEELFIVYWERHAKHTASAKPNKRCLAKWSQFFAESYLSEVTLDRQKEFLQWLTDQGLSIGYCARIFEIGRAAINYAWKNGRISEKPYIMVPEKQTEPQRILLPEETKALFENTVSEHGFMYLMLAYNTLARESTILDLQPFQFDRQRRLIDLNPAGRKQTKKRRPVVPVTDTLLPFLGQSTGEFYVNWHGRKIKSVKKVLEATAKRAGVGSVTSRTIRHTMATELRARGVPMWELEGFLGHKMPSTSERYAQYAPDYLGSAAKAIDDYMRASCAPAIEVAKKAFFA